MALTKDYSLDIVFSNISIQDTTLVPSQIEKSYTISTAYIKIISVEGSKGSINIVVGIYKDDKLIITKTYTFTPSVQDSATNFIKQAYEYLKTLNDFRDATDVLESGQTA